MAVAAVDGGSPCDDPGTGPVQSVRLPGDKTVIRATFYAVHFTLLKSKIHRACVTTANVNYEGSLAISADLAERVGLEEYERILVGNMGNGERFETYVIYGTREHGLIELNGATAYLGKPGDRLTIMSFGLYTPEEARTHQPQVIIVDEKNRVLRHQ